MKKRNWFDLGAAACGQACPGTYDVPTYVCPICWDPFTVEALDDGRLSMEHVPPQSVGGCELLLTCTVCNNRAGTKLDAAAKTKGFWCKVANRRRTAIMAGNECTNDRPSSV